MPVRAGESYANAVARLEDDLYRDRILPFDIAASKEYGANCSVRANGADRSDRWER